MLRLLHLWFWFRRGMTLGTRAIVQDQEGRIFLVRHSYISGWHLPGGGVEWGQTLEEGLAMELREEGNIHLTRPPQWVGMYFNRAISRRDHVALFLVEGFEQTSPRLPDREILEARFFPRDRLPEGTSAATRRRLAEVFDAAPKSPYW
jgi:ADP-ribose pyrophosphatase YjhB (NUDIX family)